MDRRRSLTALGLMSGTSLDGVDAAIVRTDGERVDSMGPCGTFPYEADFRDRLRGVLGTDPEGGTSCEAVARELTERHVRAVRALLHTHGLTPSDIDVVGLHGHTVLHRPQDGVTRQIGDGRMLAQETGIAVVSDFRRKDVAAGGEGAPLAPIYHGALVRDLKTPVAVLNIGGVANVTWIGDRGAAAPRRLVAFDTGPGNALIDDWVRQTTGRPFDRDGRLAAAGRVDEDVLSTLLAEPYFARPPPKSLDRDEFVWRDAVGSLSVADGAATLTAFTARAVVRARAHLPLAPRRWLVSGGGRHNGVLMATLQDALAQQVDPVDRVGWLGDALEAQAFGFLAVRSLYGLPLSFPATTGVPRPLTGGVLHRPRSSDAMD